MALIFPPESVKPSVSQPWLHRIELTRGLRGRFKKILMSRLFPGLWPMGKRPGLTVFLRLPVGDSSMLTTTLTDYWLFVSTELKGWLKNIFFPLEQQNLLLSHLKFGSHHRNKYLPMEQGCSVWQISLEYRENHKGLYLSFPWAHSNHCTWICLFIRIIN